MLTRLLKHRALTRTIGTHVAQKQHATHILIRSNWRYGALQRRIDASSGALLLQSTIISSRSYCTNRKKDEEQDLEVESAEYIVNKDPQLPATVAVPEVWPHLPLLATRRNPVFPRFMKILEVRYESKIKSHFPLEIFFMYYIILYILYFCRFQIQWLLI